ncbi:MULTISPECIES: acyl carrier protein [unclassified Streptomyces]|uniref:acyl carrier protein n=1 Tax=unclassified Streptomyces TaxID=2593676 RepID=UPI0034499841
MNGSTGITEEVTEFLTAALRRPIGPDDDYFAMGLANSLFALELVTFVEERFSFTVEVEDLDLDSFRTANRITDLVLRKTGADRLTETHDQGA